jgi:hypothetical protein
VVVMAATEAAAAPAAVVALALLEGPQVRFPPVFFGIKKGKIGNISHRGDFFMFIPHRRLDKLFYHTFNS